jgi:hypothetical protein
MLIKNAQMTALEMFAVIVFISSNFVYLFHKAFFAFIYTCAKPD